MLFKQRLALIHTVADAEKQIQLAKQYVRRCRNQAIKAETLPEKLAFSAKQSIAEKTLRKLRRSIFDIEEAIAEGRCPQSLFL